MKSSKNLVANTSGAAWSTKPWSISVRKAHGNAKVVAAANIKKSPAQATWTRYGRMNGNSPDSDWGEDFMPFNYVHKDKSDQD
jgi:hypothetical protein